MAISYGSNIASLQALRRLGQAQNATSRSYERLASGSRLNRPSDDSAGLSIASALRVAGRVYNRALLNSNDAVSYLNVAQGSTQELSSILVRMKELAQQSANGSLSSTQRSSLNNEAQKLSQEYNRLISSTRFNGLTIHGANQGQTVTQLGFGTSSTVGFELGNSLERDVGTGSYSGGTVLGIGASSDSLSADLNGDGNLDLVTINSASIIGQVAFGNGDGTFKAPSAITSASGNMTSIRSGDFDNDGDLDLIATTASTKLQYFQNNAGSLATGATISPSGTSVTHVEVGDFNGDGNLDFAASGSTAISGIVFAVFGNGNGTFKSPSTLGSFNSASSLAVADFNGDGRSDIIANNDSTSALSLFKGSAAGNFSTSTFTGFRLGQKVIAGDFNNDGTVDLAATETGIMKLYLNSGNATFSASSSITISGAANNVTDFEVADINLDGLIDIVGMVSSDSVAFSLLGNGNGTFQAIQNSTVGTVNGLSVGDFNGDGIGELIASSAFNTSMYSSSETQVTTMSLFDLSTQDAALNALDIIEQQIEKVSKELGVLGAAMSRVESASHLLSATVTDYAAAQSRIEDVDIAQESADLTKNQILQNTTAAILGQANLIPSLALKLLQF